MANPKMQPVAINKGNRKIQLKFAGDDMTAATKLKSNMQITRPKINMDDFKELFAALFKIKDRCLQARIMKAINNMPEKCPNCAYNLLERKPSAPVSGAEKPGPLVKDHSISINNNKQLNSTNCRSTQTIKSEFDKPSADKVEHVTHQSPKIKSHRFRRTRMPHVIKNMQTINESKFLDSDDVKRVRAVSVNNNASFCARLPEVSHLILLNKYTLVRMCVCAFILQSMKSKHVVVSIHNNMGNPKVYQSDVTTSPICNTIRTRARTCSSCYYYSLSVTIECNA